MAPVVTGEAGKITNALLLPPSTPVLKTTNLPKSGSDIENPLLMEKRQKRSRNKVMHNYQIYPKCHPDGRCPSPDGTEETLAALF